MNDEVVPPITSFSDDDLLALLAVKQHRGAGPFSEDQIDDELFRREQEAK
jgi:hypothetical protein